MSEGAESNGEDRLFEGEGKAYGLEERTFGFARETRAFVKGLDRTLGNVEDAKQLIRASGSVGANFIEAVEAVSLKDFIHRVKICRKEAKESRYWLRLLHIELPAREHQRQALIQEAQELMLILNAIVKKHDGTPR